MSDREMLFDQWVGPTNEARFVDLAHERSGIVELHSFTVVTAVKQVLASVGRLFP